MSELFKALAVNQLISRLTPDYPATNRCERTEILMRDACFRYLSICISLCTASPPLKKIGFFLG